MAEFFDVYSIEKVFSADFDQKVLTSPELTCVFFWGHDCPNCDIAKRVLIDRKDQVDLLGLKWFHANIYEDFDLATRFGLFGIPVFLFFKDGKKLGKISPFPGFDPFFEAIQNLQAQLSRI